MRIVQLANFHAPGSGGLRTVVDRLRVGYVAAGHEAALVVPGAAPERVETPAGVTVVVPGVRLGRTYRVLVRRAAVADVLAELEPDRIEVSDKLSLGWVGAWARRRAVPAVLVSHERIDAILADRVPAGVPLRSFADRRNAALAHRFDRVVCTSAFAQAEFDRIGATTVKIPLGVDLGVFRPSPSWTPDPSGALRMVMVGRLSTEKRPEVAVDVLRSLRACGIDARLTVVGDGPSRHALERRAAGLPVLFTGHLAQPAMLRDVVVGADVCIAPCPADTFGLAVLEALACGVPAVVPSVGGPAELVRGGAGAVVAGDLASFVDGVLEVARRDPVTRREAARRRAEAFPWHRCIDGFLRLHGAVASMGRVA
ncbi:MAG: glycosyltransferase [Acidimicrobiales bacterium]|nr:glycosyltransferase [Acidimicrobiales bacterium]